MELDSVRLSFSQDSLLLLNIILGVIMFGIALDLKAGDFRRIIVLPKAPIIGLVAQFVMLPAFTFVLIYVLGPAPSIALGMLLVASCPGGNISNFITHFAKGNAALSITMTAISTCAAIFMTPLNLSLWGNLNPETSAILKIVNLDPWAMLKLVFVLLGVPLATGLIFSRKFPKFSSKLKTPFKVFSLIAFVGFVVIAIAKNFDIFLNHVHWVALAVVLHNAMAFMMGNLFARLGRLSAWDTRAVTIEVGIQNSALALVLIFNFFGGMGGMALIAGLWGIWHIISGLILASVWSRSPCKSEN